MLGKKSNLVIEIFTGSFVSGHISGILDFATSPKSHMELKAQSPKGLKTFDIGGVGLAIVASLENSGGGRHEIPANKALFGRNLSRSNPIPVNSQNRLEKNIISKEITEAENLEEYTVVTCHGPKESYTKVYYNNRTPFRIQNRVTNNRASVFHISPVKVREVEGISSTDFLNSCDLCHKKLDGKDIYMYKGEKAFCSTECRYKQIVVDERIEKCSSKASRPVDVSGSPYSNEQILSTGILAV